jgi:hypothetical protein
VTSASSARRARDKLHNAGRPLRRPSMRALLSAAGAGPLRLFPVLRQLPGRSGEPVSAKAKPRSRHQGPALAERPWRASWWTQLLAFGRRSRWRQGRRLCWAKAVSTMGPEPAGATSDDGFAAPTFLRNGRRAGAAATAARTSAAFFASPTIPGRLDPIPGRAPIGCSRRRAPKRWRLTRSNS